MAGQNDEVLRALGRLEEGVRLHREDFLEEKVAARDSRSAINCRLDKQQEDISHLETTVVVSGPDGCSAAGCDRGTDRQDRERHRRQLRKF